MLLDTLLFTLPRPDPIVKPSLSLGYLASYVEQHGIEVDCLDLEAVTGNDSSKWNLVEELLVKSIPGVVGISIVHPNSLPDLLHLAKLAKQIGSKIVVGGYGATFWPEQIMKAVPEVDIAIRGEGELALLSLLQHWLGLENGSDCLKSVVVRNDSNGYIYTDKSDLVQNLDDLPFPRRTFAEPEYKGDLSDGVSVISASRGCVANCSFCSIRQFYSTDSPTRSGRWRTRSPENIVEEMEKVVKDLDTQFFAFIDDDFIGSIKLGGENRRRFAELLIQKNLNIKFRFGTRINNIDQDLFTLLRDAGLVCVDTGVESISQKALELYNKGISPKQIRDKLAILEKLGIQFRPTMIPFNHGTTLDDLAEHVEFIRYLQHAGALILPSSFINNVIPWPGTPLRNQYRKDGILDSDYYDLESDSSQVVPSYTFTDYRVQLILEQLQISVDELIRKGTSSQKLNEILTELLDEMIEWGRTIERPQVN